MQRNMEGFVEKLVNAKLERGSKCASPPEETPSTSKKTRIDDWVESPPPSPKDPLDYELFSDSEEGEIQDEEDSLAEDFAGPIQTGPAIPEKLAAMMNSLFEEKLPETEEN